MAYIFFQFDRQHLLTGLCALQQQQQQQQRSTQTTFIQNIAKTRTNGCVIGDLVQLVARAKLAAVKRAIEGGWVVLDYISIILVVCQVMIEVEKIFQVSATTSRNRILRRRSSTLRPFTNKM